MNSTSQLDLHPDAESLNAFAEQALATPEREQVLAHLARCGRCRQVIYLAQQAAADAPAPARVSVARPATHSVTWFWNWRFAWVPAAAMAAALALVVTLHTRHTEPAVQMAKLAPLSEAAAPAPAPREQASAGAAHKPALAKKSVARDVEFGAHRRPPQMLAVSSAAPPAEPSGTAPSTGGSVAALPSSIYSAQQPETATYSLPEPAVAAWQQEQQRMPATLSASADASQVSQKSLRMEAYPAHASGQAASAGPRVAQQSTPTSSFDIGTQQQLSPSTASRKAIPLVLPSGLTAVSRAATRNLMLQLDLDGVLFWSGDSGEHWEPVARQWTGRAIQVRAKTGLSGNATPFWLFELKNDSGTTWTSADGKTWTAQ